MQSLQAQNLIYYKIADVLYTEGQSERSDIAIMQTSMEFLNYMNSFGFFNTNYILSNDNKIYTSNSFVEVDTVMTPYLNEYFLNPSTNDTSGKTHWLIDNANNLYFWRTLLSADNGFSDSGIHIVELNIEYLFEKCGTYYLESDQQIYLTDNSFNLISPNGEVPAETQTILNEVTSIESILSHPQKIHEHNFNGDNYILQSRELYNNELFVLSITPVNSLLNDTHTTLYYFVLFCGISIIISVLLTFIYISNMTKNINLFTTHLNSFTVDNFTEIEIPKTQDEIVDIIKTFNKMGQKNKKLVDDVYISNAKQKSEELRALQFEYSALQSKINPHFLYNTLETINSMAKLSENEEISEAVCILGSLLRQRTRSDKPFISLEEELDGTIKYLEIHKLNFGDKLKVITDVSDNCKAALVPRLILQPLVENSIMHGLESSTYVFEIFISAMESGEDVLISVTDNGSGIPAEILNKLLNAQTQSENLDEFDNVMLTDAAKEFNVSSSYLSRLLKKELDMNFTDIVTRIRIDHAKEHLHNLELKIIDVSNLVGFSDYTYFSQVFKKLEGISPNEYRKLFCLNKY